MIVDCHCHAGPGHGLTGPWDTTARIGTYLRRAAQAGITHTNLFAAFHSDYAVANRAVGRIVAAHPERLFGFAFVHATRDKGRVARMVDEGVRRLGFCGIKVHRYDARLTAEICDVARAFSLPVLYDPMGEIAPIELFAREYRDVNFIIPHLGSFADDWRAQLAFVDHLQRHPNVYTDTSGVRRFDLLVEALRRGGPAKVLFGSDGPWLHPGVELAKVKLLGLPREAEALVLGKNFLRLVGTAKRKMPRTTIQARSEPPRTDDPWAAEQLAWPGVT